MLAWLFVSAASADPTGLDAVNHALSMRHPVPCGELLAHSETPVETLLHVVDHTSMPPWAPMRAAECLMEVHPTEIESRLLRWVTTPELKGLGRLTLGQLDRMPVEVATRVATEALANGTEPERALQVCHDAERAELRALALAVTP